MEEIRSLRDAQPHEFLRTRRRALGLTQKEVAARVDSTQSVVAAIETGKRSLTSPMEQKFREALKADPAKLLERHREEIREEAEKIGLAEVRVFGSVARGEAREDSDIDLLVAWPEESQRGAFVLMDFAERVEHILGVPVDVKLRPPKEYVTPAVQQVLSESIAL